ncbi:DUF1553 domain-containing protein [Bythopirellula polymerisocia]|nr:DUF1553 domain-containing protein [Bythopirellula polymerisocia]
MESYCPPILQIRNQLRTRLVLILAAVLFPASANAVLPEIVDYNFHIKPILSDRCYACHGPDEETREGGFRLDLRDSAFGEADSGAHPIIPIKPAQSEILSRLTSADEDFRMPPADSKLSVSEEEIALLRRWIEQGAEWKQHWAFLPVQVPDGKYIANSIDRFVLDRLEHEGLESTGEATREELIRRVSFDLTGLPPTVEEIDTFSSDSTENAYERVVDRLLQSPRFGERLAVEWLDVARYADTYGYQADRYRAVWQWRDWVVQAFNENLPYDQFIIWQLAGDLLPNATDEQILATAFNRLHRQTNEGGSIEEEFRNEYVVDRVDTFGTAFLGLTIQCARCHDHKFDSITQREYYELYAFFNNINESGLYSHFTDAVPTPTLLQETPSKKEVLSELEQKIEIAESDLKKIAEQTRSQFVKDLEKGLVSIDGDGPIGIFSMDGLDRDSLANRVHSEESAELEGNPDLISGRFGKALKFNGENNFSTDVGGKFTRDDAFSISFWLNTPDEKSRAVVLHRSRSWTDAGSRGYEVLISDGKLQGSLIHFLPGNAISVRTTNKLPLKEWVHICLTYDGSSRADGLKLFVNGNPTATEIIADQLTKTILYKREEYLGGEEDFAQAHRLTLGQRFRDRGFKEGAIDELQIYDCELTPLEVAELHGGNMLTDLLGRNRQELSQLEREQLFKLFVNHNEKYRDALQGLKLLRQQRSRLLDELPEIMVMRELSQRRPAYLLARGAYDSPQVEVVPNTPKSLPDMNPELPRDRLGLARWLTDPNHPLTARVAVNRYWQMLFGRGLVATANDLGSQGQLPSHPELLDYLAFSFIESGWDLKAMLKQIVMSNTYRQSPQCNLALRERDPHNELLARGPQQRLTAEMMRDSALFASGLLVEKRGGPPVKPYEPPGLWEEKGSESYVRDVGEGSHRRSLYTFWKRTSPPPSMITFDAANREVCVVNRQMTTTPLQALLLMNDPQYVEAARAAAEKSLLQGSDSSTDRLDDLFRSFTSRMPTGAEQKVLSELYEEQLDYYKSDRSFADKFLNIGDHQNDRKIDPAQLAALTVVAQTIMNHFDAIVK